jgi:hypothetical protein
MEDKMQKIDIQITKAVIESFRVEMKDDIPEVSVTIGLSTEQNQRVTGFSISSNHWDDSQKFDLPWEVVQPIVDIAKRLEKVVTARCQATVTMLTAPAEEKSDG